MPKNAKRKRNAKSPDPTSSKRIKTNVQKGVSQSVISTRLLPFYYNHVCTLRSFVQAKYVRKSKFLDDRLRKYEPSSPLALLLDTTLIGSSGAPNDFQANGERVQRSKDFLEFTQRASGRSNRRISDGTTVASTLGEGGIAIADLVDFAVWRLFNRTYRLVDRPSHLLCHGFQRSAEPRNSKEDRAVQGGIDGLTIVTANPHVKQLKRAEWAELLSELGLEGDQTILELLLDCGVFVPVHRASLDEASNTDEGNFWQISGISIGELPLLKPKDGSDEMRRPPVSALKMGPPPAPIVRSQSSISFVRSRMFYARATLNGKGKVHFGLRHIHVLNRYPSASNEAHTTHVLKYVFPRQFGLHNVFTSKVDRRETAYTFKDYTLREHEIGSWVRQHGTRAVTKVPKRLRGECLELVRKLQRLHGGCPYKELLLYYCPVPELDHSDKWPSAPGRKRKRTSDAFLPTSTQAAAQAKALLGRAGNHEDQRHLTDLATPVASVSAFVRSVIRKVLPGGFFGHGPDGDHNFSLLLKAIHEFIICKRFENLTLDSVCQTMRISTIDWLRPCKVPASEKMSLTDFSKRKELFNELLYYNFDSLIIPLIRSNFHVTESNDHKYRLFYFRHDVWRLITQPAISRIKHDMFREISAGRAQQILNQRSLGFSQVRLLPKRASVRTIANLRRRAMIKRNGKTYLAASINSTLKTAFSMLNYEKNHNRALLQSSIFSVNELYPQLITFQARLKSTGLSGRPLYFVKVDVQSCFDTIPQKEMIELIERICHGSQYTIKHHTEVKSALPQFRTGIQHEVNKPSRKYLTSAHATQSSQEASFEDLVKQDYSTGKKNTVFVEGFAQTKIDTEGMLDLLDEHVMRNIVKIGKRFYRQRNGIPQGSILSTLLCSFFYGDFEARKLRFLRQTSNEACPSDTMLIRLIDDFLLITTDRNRAERFLGIMLAGNTEYGITVKPAKTLTNFKPSSTRLETNVLAGTPFPWCNLLINTKTLAITRDRSKTLPYIHSMPQSTQPLLKLRGSAPDLADSMTLEAHKRTGAAFHRKIMAVLRLNLRRMYVDACSTTTANVAREVFVGLLEVAERAGRYLVRLSKLRNGQGLRSKVVQHVIQDVSRSTCALLRKGRIATGGRRIGKTEVEIMIAKAFETVLNRQQSRHRETLDWLKQWQAQLQVDDRFIRQLLKVK